MPAALVRCPWSETHALHIPYHDEEWGAPVRDDRRLFEFLILEGAQAGLSWLTILKKRDTYRTAFKQFDPEKVARFGHKDVERLLADPGIIRNRLKINAAVTNAARFLDVAEKHGSFSDFIWSYVDGKPIKNAWKRSQDVPASTPLSDRISKDLKKLGFKFVGTTIIYAHMQATGMVNDHLASCFRYDQV